MSLGVEGQNASEKQETCIHIDAHVIHSRITELNAKRKENQMCLKHLLWVSFFVRRVQSLQGQVLKINPKANIIPNFTLKKKNKKQKMSSEMISNCVPGHMAFRW